MRLTRTITIRIGERDRRNLEELAKLEDRCIGNVIRQAITAFLDGKAREYRPRSAMGEYRADIAVERLTSENRLARMTQELMRGIR